MKKIISLILAVTMVLTVFSVNTTAQATTKFSDVNTSDWYYANLIEAVEKGIINGYPDGTFRPNDKLKFEEFVKMVITATFTAEEIESSSKDEPNTQWYSKIFAVARKYFVINSDDNSLINTNIKRSKMAELSYNYLAYTQDLDGNKTDKDGFKQLNYEELKYMSRKFQDVKTGTPINDMILHIAQLGIINGYTDNTFKPNDSLTRAEALTVVLRLIDETKRTPIEINLKEGEIIDKSELIPEPQLEFVNNEKDYMLLNTYVKNTANYSEDALYKLEVVGSPELHKREIRNAPTYPYVTSENYNLWYQFRANNSIFGIPTKPRIANEYIEAKEKWEELKAGHKLTLKITVQDKIDGELIEKIFYIEHVLSYDGIPNVQIVR